MREKTDEELRDLAAFHKVTLDELRATMALGRRISAEARRRGLNDSKLLRAAGINPKWLQLLKSGERTNPTTGHLQKIANVLGLALNDLLTSGAHRTPSAAVSFVVDVVGAIEAGALREAARWPEERWRKVPVMTLDEAVGRMPLFAYELRSPIHPAFPAGATLICAAYDDLGREPKVGDVIVCAIPVDGLCELSLREVVEHEGRPRAALRVAVDGGDRFVRPLDLDEIEVVGAVVQGILPGVDLSHLE